MSRRTVSTPEAPAAIGPYAQGIVANGVLYTAMQIALDPASGELVGATAVEQARRCLTNLQAIIHAAGGSMTDVVKTIVYLTDLSAFGAVNEVYAEFFNTEVPARGVVEVVALPKGALIAVEAIATIA